MNEKQATKVIMYSKGYKRWIYTPMFYTYTFINDADNKQIDAEDALSHSLKEYKGKENLIKAAQLILTTLNVSINEVFPSMD